MVSIDITQENSAEESCSMDNLYKIALLKLLGKLPQGNLILRDDDHVILEVKNHGQLTAEINITSNKFYKKVLLDGSIGAGEAYTHGYWESKNLTDVIRLFAANSHFLDSIEKKFDCLTYLPKKLLAVRNRNSKKQAKSNISAHYDLGNELYKQFLDPSMLYSSAIYPDANANLTTAQQHKLATICRKLDLTEKDHLLEIGTGWGALAIFAVQNYGCKVTTTTISEEQHLYVSELIDQLKLTDKITLLKKDYRDLTGTYDKVVSIEMIEAVGKSYMKSYIEKCEALLKQDGILLIQAITISDHRFEQYSKNIDFIQKHIFPGGFLPSISFLLNHFGRQTQLVLRDLHDIGLHYAKTCRDWRLNLDVKQQQLNQLGYDDTFIRLWRFYLSYCEGGFMERVVSAVQILLTGPQYVDKINRH